MPDQITHFKQVVITNGYRWTRARKAIIEGLIDCEGHITADALAAKVREANPHVGRMTVYRTLDLLCELGVLRPIYQGTGAAHYILMTGGSHHHLICTRCSRVIEFDHCTAGEFAQGMGEDFDFDVSGHLLELYGTCKKCSLI
jgi:Fur family ferric uptake transcriptional regulator